MKWAANFALGKYPDLDIGVKSANLVWRGAPGAQLMTLPQRLEDMASRLGERRRPTSIVIHLGGNDLGGATLLQLRGALQEAVGAAQRLFPGCTLVWSDILPRVRYSAAGSQAKIEGTRKRLNRQARGVFSRCGGHVLTHPGFSWEKAELFRGDGVHLSDLGNQRFLDTFREGLTLFSLYPSLFRYPPF